ncbi:hypothetical protein Tco_0679051 [Tanacetum coccineum]|uniref:Uncharacterized protein n=1 Tax=Tanacetum coccineum TaxID=301880 RepID=A0ABQ4XGX2_9ASTR
MLVVLVMCMQWPSKGQEVDGNKCLETGGKIGNPTLTSMDSPYLLRSQQVMAELWYPTMLHLLAGPLVRPSVVPNFDVKATRGWKRGDGKNNGGRYSSIPHPSRHVRLGDMIGGGGWGGKKWEGSGEGRTLWRRKVKKWGGKDIITLHL